MLVACVWVDAMRTLVETSRLIRWSQVVAIALVAGAAAGCSSDVMRFTSDPMVEGGRSDRTASISRAPAAPVGRVESRPMAPAPVASAPIATVPARNLPRNDYASAPSYSPATSYPQPQAGGTAGSMPETTASLPAPKPLAPKTTAGGWSWEGGTAITAQSGDTAETLSKRYGVPTQAILQSNNLSDGNSIQPGQRIIIPAYRVGGASSPAPAAPQIQASAPQTAPAYKPVAAAVAGKAISHKVSPGETLSGIAHKYHVPREDLAKANGLGVWDQVKVGQQLNIPGAKASASRPAQRADVADDEVPAAAPVAKVTKSDKASKVADAAKDKAAKLAEAKAKKAEELKLAAQKPAKEQLAKAKDEAVAKVAAVQPTADIEEKTGTAGSSGPSGFRWPVRGRVVSGYGAKSNGRENDGINMAVPEGTPVRAAEDGVVAYAGSELSSYGNLVLVRHSNGFVTAYAHNSELNVKRGDTVKRGQAIAKSGQSGDVNSPQVHFEIRKGSQAVDPVPHLTGN